MAVAPDAVMAMEGVTAADSEVELVGGWVADPRGRM